MGMIQFAIDLRISPAQLNTIIYFAGGIAVAFWALLMLAIVLRNRGR